ncbi:hypothetical protein BST61_g4138 [Cercospora zeina]
MSRISSFTCFLLSNHQFQPSLLSSFVCSIITQPPPKALLLAPASCKPASPSAKGIQQRHPSSYQSTHRALFCAQRDLHTCSANTQVSACGHPPKFPNIALPNNGKVPDNVALKNDIGASADAVREAYVSQRWKPKAKPKRSAEGPRKRTTTLKGDTRRKEAQERKEEKERTHNPTAKTGAAT